ncbi:hypothetical protein L0244_39105, partial [bacterium]|nr:hypothetical protein [bacterium]
PQPSYKVYLEDDEVGSKEHQALLNVSGVKDSKERYDFDDQYAVAKSDLFDAYIRDLPVIARNQLNNGISKNLWYEEVAPHQTLFITYIAATNNDFCDFEKELLQPLQIGGNASVGYGVCQFHKIEFKS